MAVVKVITGYVEIPDHPRPREWYDEQRQNFKKLKASGYLFGGPVEDTWLYQEASKVPEVVWPIGDNPDKNTLAYHCVQHQKTAWLNAAQVVDSRTDVFVWMDMGIWHQPGVTTEVVDDFLERVAANPPITLATPGCWSRGDYTPLHVCWRFCGSLLVANRACLEPLDLEVRKRATRLLERESAVTWEVNTWAAVEHHREFPFGWYNADHNASMFTNYPG